MSPVQHCQRCLNHNVHEPRKGHQCPQKACVCWKCKLVVERRACNRKLSKLAVNNGSGGGDPVGTTPPAEDDDLHFGVIRSCSDPGPRVNKKERRPACAACRHHTGLIIPLRGHKRACPYRNCGCSVCEVVTQRRNIMAKQVKLRRQQQHLRHSPLDDSHSDDHSTSTATTPRAEDDRDLSCADPNIDLVSSLAQLQPYESSPQPSYLQSLLAQSAGFSATELLAAEFLVRCSQQQSVTPDYNSLLAALIQQQRSPQVCLNDGGTGVWSSSPSPVASPFGTADMTSSSKSPFGTTSSGSNLPVIVLPLVYMPQGGYCPLAPTLTYFNGSVF